MGCNAMEKVKLGLMNLFGNLSYLSFLLQQTIFYHVSNAKKSAFGCYLSIYRLGALLFGTGSILIFCCCSSLQMEAEAEHRCSLPHLNIFSSVAYVCDPG